MYGIDRRLHAYLACLSAALLYDDKAAELSVVEFVAVHGLSFAGLLADAAAAAVVAADVI